MMKVLVILTLCLVVFAGVTESTTSLDNNSKLRGPSNAASFRFAAMKEALDEGEDRTDAKGEEAAAAPKKIRQMHADGRNETVWMLHEQVPWDCYQRT